MLASSGRVGSATVVAPGTPLFHYRVIELTAVHRRIGGPSGTTRPGSAEPQGIRPMSKIRSQSEGLHGFPERKSVPAGRSCDQVHSAKSSDKGTRSVLAIRRRFRIARFRAPRLTDPMNVRCNSHRSPNSACESPRAIRSSRIRSPNRRKNLWSRFMVDDHRAAAHNRIS